MHAEMSARAGTFLLLLSSLLLGLLVHQAAAQAAQKVIYKVCVPREKTAECENMGRSDSEVKCVLVHDSTDCALKLSRNEVDFGMLTAEQLLVASYFLDEEGPRAVSVLGEVRDEERLHEEFAFTAIGIARRSRVPSGNLGKEKNLSLCHPGLGRMSSGWSDRVLTELDVAMLEATNTPRCDEWRSELENHFASVAKVWGPSCRPGSWSVHGATDGTLKEQNPSLCSTCPDRKGCSYGANDAKPHEAALDCLKRGGDVAFVALSYSQEFIRNISRDDVRSEWALVCPQLNLGVNSTTCRWARQAWGGVAARKAIARQLGPKLLDWLRPIVPRELGVTEPTARRQDGWQRALIDVILDDYQVYTSAREELSPAKYIGRGRRIPTLESEHLCSKQPMRWCSKEGAERTKCNWMSTAAMTAGVKPPITCLGAEDGLACAKLVSNHQADIVVTNIDDAHRASMWDLADTSQQDFKVGANMYVETTQEYDRHVVALVRWDSDIRNASELRDRKACFPVADGIAYGAFLSGSMKHEQLPGTCPYHAATDEYLGDSCVPGVNSADYPSLCQLCQSGVGGGDVDPYSINKPACSASEGNLFYGTPGALRCLHSGGGEIAFVDLQAAKDAIEQQIVPGIKDGDFKVLCGAGLVLPTDRGLDGAEKCARAHAPAGAALCRAALEPHAARNVHDTLVTLDGLFGLGGTSHPSQSFYLYRPFNNTRGLIFPIGTVGMLPKESKAPSVEGYIKLQVSVPKPCGSTGYNAAPASVSAISALSLLLLAALVTLRNQPDL